MNTHKIVANIIRPLQLATIQNCGQHYLTTSHVSSLFDGYAKKFESHLEKELNYNAPKKLLGLLESTIQPTPHFTKVLDLGCGTGLVGKTIAPLCDHLVGIDLSKKMLQESHKKGIYNELIQIDIVEFIKSSQQTFDLAIAADVFIYVGKVRAYC